MSSILVIDDHDTMRDGVAQTLMRLGHAVANAHESVLAAADRVVPSHDEDGVARTLAEALGLGSL